MKAEKAKAVFAPITLTIESQAELDWLYALSQSSIGDAMVNAEQLGFKLSQEAKLVQMPLYHTLRGLKNA